MLQLHEAEDGALTVYSIYPGDDVDEEQLDELLLDLDIPTPDMHWATVVVQAVEDGVLLGVIIADSQDEITMVVHEDRQREGICTQMLVELERLEAHFYATAGSGAGASALYSLPHTLGRIPNNIEWSGYMFYA